MGRGRPKGEKAKKIEFAKLEVPRPGELLDPS